MMDYCLDRDIIPLTIRLFKQPATDKEETRQTKQKKNPRIASIYSILCLAIMTAKIQNYSQ